MTKQIRINGRSFTISDHATSDGQLKLRTFSLTGSKGAQYGALELIDNRGIFRIMKFSGRVTNPFPSTYLKMDEAHTVTVVGSFGGYIQA